MLLQEDKNRHEAACKERSNTMELQRLESQEKEMDTLVMLAAAEKAKAEAAHVVSENKQLRLQLELAKLRQVGLWDITNAGQ